MFKNTKAFSSFSVHDLEKTKQFYHEILGLEVQKKPEGLELHIGDKTMIFIYPSPNNAPADFTILNFVVDDIEKAVSELTHKGVRMEHYDIPELKTDEKGIARGESGPRAMAWFKDPAGNILSVLQEK